jgi:predicted small secreted protein
MKLKTRILGLLLLLSVTLTPLAFTGCHTANGFGKDMEDAGQSIQKETK